MPLSAVFCRRPLATAILLLLLSPLALAQQEAIEPVEEVQAPKRVGVQAVSSDAAIAERLARILQATGWFEKSSVEVRDGVVFLEGRAQHKEQKAWAGDLAGNTQDVVAVVNRLQVAEGAAWDFSPALGELKRLWRQGVESLPLLVFTLLILALAMLAARLAGAVTRRLLRERLNPLLRDVTARTFAILVLILGLYLALRVAGLTRLAVTLLGGTGLVGLVLGIAFRDILENFLASILISLRNPFKAGDLVEIAGQLGVVQKVTTRGTVLMDHDGNHVQIPNATVYKSTILNFTANPKRRMNFEVGIGYENLIPEAQKTALAVLRAHPAVLEDPEPLVLVERLGPAAVALRIHFWFDGTRHDGFKIRSALIRLVKRAFQDRDISMPDEAREIIFPQGIPVRLLEAAPETEKRPPPPAPESAAVATDAEGDLSSDEAQIKAQARQARTPEQGADLLAE
jgi:small-conductance mechanosensitive channel